MGEHGWDQLGGLESLAQEPHPAMTLDWAATREAGGGRTSWAAAQGDRNGSTQEPQRETRELSNYSYVSKEGREKRLK